METLQTHHGYAPEGSKLPIMRGKLPIKKKKKKGNSPKGKNESPTETEKTKRKREKKCEEKKIPAIDDVAGIRRVVSEDLFLGGAKPSHLCYTCIFARLAPISD